MKKILLSLLLLTFFSIVYAQNVAAIAGMKGNIKILRDKKTIIAKTGDIIKNADEISSGEESFAAIRFIDNGATTKLFPNSIIIISASVEGNTLNKRNSISKGTARSQVSPRSGNYIVETPNTVASVKGTDFLATYEDFLTTIGVIDGEVEVRNKTSDRSIDANANDVIQGDDEGNLDSIDDSSYIKNNLDEEAAEGQVYGGSDDNNFTDTADRHSLEIELVDPDGTIKKVRISYE